MYDTIWSQLPVNEKHYASEDNIMAKTAKGNKRTYVRNYTRSNGTTVGNHYRSNPKTSKGKKK